MEKDGFTVTVESLTNLYVTKSSVQYTMFFVPAIVKCMEKNLDITKPLYSEHIFTSPLALR